MPGREGDSGNVPTWIFRAVAGALFAVLSFLALDQYHARGVDREAIHSLRVEMATLRGELATTRELLKRIEDRLHE